MSSQVTLQYRWVIVAVASVILAIVMGQLVNGLSTFFTPLEEAEGWLRGEIAFINTAGLVGIAAGGIAMGFLAERIAIRRIALSGVLTFALAMIAASRATSLWQLYALFAIAGAFGGGALFAPLFTLVGTWFTRGAGLAIGIVSAGTALGQGGVPFTNALLIEAMGWRGALLTIGLVALIVLLPLALLIRAPEDLPDTQVGQAHVEVSPLADKWRLVTLIMCAAALCCCTLMAVPLMHLVPFIQTRGISAPDAGSVVFVMMLVAIVGRVAFGKFADMIGALRAYMVASGWQTALVFGFVPLTDLGQFYIYAPIYAFGYAGVMTGVLTTIRFLIPAERRASASGLIIAFAYLGHGVGGYLGGAIYDVTGGYVMTFGIAAALGLVNLSLLSVLWWMSGGRRRQTGFSELSA